MEVQAVQVAEAIVVVMVEQEHLDKEIEVEILQFQPQVKQVAEEQEQLEEICQLQVLKMVLMAVLVYPQVLLDHLFTEQEAVQVLTEIYQPLIILVE